jgi:hypothetical protein
MWTLFWAVMTIALTLLATVPDLGHFNALILGLSGLSGAIFAFCLTVMIGRWRQERDRKGSQPMRAHYAAPNAHPLAPPIDRHGGPRIDDD